MDAATAFALFGPLFLLAGALIWLVVRQNKRRKASGGKVEGTPLIVWVLSFAFIFGLMLLVLKFGRD